MRSGPGDIVTSLSGKTMEVLNTDAEGRLILVDAITYAIRLGCTHLVDAATLTGAIVVALGHIHIGAFTNNEEFLGRVVAAGNSGGERMWHMPLDDDYKDYLKSSVRRSPEYRRPMGRRDYGGEVPGGVRRRQAMGASRYRGHRLARRRKPYLAKGPSGVPVRTFINLAMNWGK